MGWFVCLEGRRRRAETRGIRRLTSDIGLRPKASCPAGSEVSRWTPALLAGEHENETVGAGEGTGRPATLHHTRRPERTAEAGLGAGEFSPSESGFLKT